MKSNITVPDIFNGSLPHIDHIHTPLVEAIEAIDNHDVRHSQIGKDLTDLWNQLNLSVSSLEQLIKSKEQDLISKQIRLSDNPSLYINVGDTFSTDNYIDPSSNATLDSEAGYIILPLESIENLNTYIEEIKISPESKGRPGDISTVRSINISKVKEFNSKKESDGVGVNISSEPNDDPMALIDQRPDTVYIWENITVPRQQPLARYGREGATVYTPGAKVQDVIEVSNNIGLTWKGVIPGIGETDRPLFNFNDIAEDATLIVNLSFSSPVPLSTVRLTSISDLGLPLPVVEKIEVLTETGIGIPPGLPRTVSPQSGKDVEIVKSSLTNNKLEGSGIFQLKLNSNATGVRIYLRAKPRELQHGVAHRFISKQVDKSQKHYIFGVRAATINSKSTNRVTSQNENIIPTVSTNTELKGKWYSSVVTAEIYNQKNNILSKLNKGGNAKDLPHIKLFSRPEQKPKTQFEDYFTPDSPTNISKDQKSIERYFNNALNRGTASQRQKLADASETAQALNKLAGKEYNKVLSQIGGKRLTGMLGLTGPAGILIGAALNGSLYNTTRTVQMDYLERIDVWKGYRALIGLRDISVDSRVYSSNAEIVTEKLVFTDRVRAVSLYSDIQIPEDWGPGLWFESYIQPENSNEWFPIKSVNSPISVDTSSTQIVFPSSVTYVRCKFIMRRPESRVSESPIFSGYVVKGLPE